MTGDLVDALHAWAKHNPITGNVEDAELVLDLLVEHVVDHPSDLAPGDLRELLLETYPSMVTVLAPEDLGDVVPSTRDLLVFLADTGHISADLLDPLRREIDTAEPAFADAVMDPANWGPTRTLTQTMAAEGVDITDEAQVERWMAENEPDEDVSLAEALGLPDRLPALRLPSDAALAAASRESDLLRQARELASWVGDHRAVASDELTEADAAATALGRTRPDLDRLWDVALTTGFVTVEDDVASGDTDRWPGEDGDDLDTWLLAFDATVASLDLDAELSGEEDLDFAGAGAVGLSLFLDRATGIPRADLSELLQADATEDVADESVWTAWVRDHGDPAEVLLGRLADHGAVRFDGEVVHLTPLGLWAMWQQLTDGGIEIPLLPPTQEMTAADLLAAADGMPEEELEGEIRGWLASRTPAEAADGLLDAAADGDPESRLFAVAVANRLGERAVPRWRAALDQPALRAYAKVALPELGGSDVEALTVADLAWLVTDMLAVSGPDDDLDAEVKAAVPAGSELEVIEAMWRLDHPQVAEVLTDLGEHLTDRKLAKAARTAAFKATSRS